MRHSPEPSFGPGDGVDFANRFDRELAGVFERREADWRNGAVVYQVLVDRFAPPADLEAKRHLYPAPKRLRSWDEVPTAGRVPRGREDVEPRDRLLGR